MSDPLGWIGLACLLTGLVIASSELIPHPKRVTGDDEFNREYDRLINTLIDGNMFKREDAHTAVAGNLRVWVENYPHAFGHPYGCGIGEHLKISAATKRRLRDHMQRLDVLLAIQKARGTA